MYGGFIHRTREARDDDGGDVVLADHFHKGNPVNAMTQRFGSGMNIEPKIKSFLNNDLRWKRSCLARLLGSNLIDRPGFEPSYGRR